MSDTSKLVAYLRRFECVDRDGNYWSPQEILDAADRLEQLQGYVQADAEEVHAKDDLIEELKTKIANWKLATQLTGTHRTCECAACENLRASVDGYECRQ